MGINAVVSKGKDTAKKKDKAKKKVEAKKKKKKVEAKKKKKAEKKKAGKKKAGQKKKKKKKAEPKKPKTSNGKSNQWDDKECELLKEECKQGSAMMHKCAATCGAFLMKLFDEELVMLN